MENIFNDKLYSKLEKDDSFRKEKLDTFVHSLSDIKEAIDKIYNEYLPKILKNQSKEDLEDIIWDIREEFRHIDGLAPYKSDYFHFMVQI